jgi:GAF domain-containing protein
MNIRLQSDDVELMQEIAAEVALDLERADLTPALHADELKITQESATVRGGEVITLATIVLTAVGAGGALTVALSKEGFLSQLARVLEKYIERRIEIRLEDENGRTVELTGPAAQIRKMLREFNK